MHKSPWPWRDRTGRFSPLKACFMALAVAPGLWIAFALATNRLGGRPVMEAIHETGLWSVRFLLLSLAATPARAIFNWHRLVLIRRQVGLTALFYAIAHVTLYAADENWRLPTVASEILSRFYLTIGLFALVGLAVLGVTSSDHALRALGKAWKRLHRVVYGIAVLALFHYFLQSKADVGGAVLLAGLFVWQMGWRLLPAGPDRQGLPVLALGLAAAAVTGALEFAWYGLATRIDPWRVLRTETDIAYGPHPAGQVLLLCLCFAVATALFAAAHRERFRRSPWFGPALYAGGAAIVSAVLFAFNLTDAWLPDDWMFWQLAAGLLLAGAALGGLRAAMPRRGRVLDVLCTLVLLLPILAGLAT